MAPYQYQNQGITKGQFKLLTNDRMFWSLLKICSQCDWIVLCRNFWHSTNEVTISAIFHDIVFQHKSLSLWLQTFAICKTSMFELGFKNRLFPSGSVFCYLKGENLWLWHSNNFHAMARLTIKYPEWFVSSKSQPSCYIHFYQPCNLHGWSRNW